MQGGPLEHSGRASGPRPAQGPAGARWAGALAWLGDVLLDALYPPACRLCGSGLAGGWGATCALHRLEPVGLDGPRCGRCAGPLPPAMLDGGVCRSCRLAPPGFRRAHVAWDYAGSARAWVLALKHTRRAELAAVLAHALLPVVRRGLRRAAPGEPAPEVLLVPVPVHPLRGLERGQDVTGRLARELERACREARLPIGFAPALRRRRYTLEQGSELSRSRHSNVHGAFHLDISPRVLRGRLVWLVDDVLTTGATASECARVLRRAGARAVEVICVARAGGRGDTPAPDARPPGSP